MKKFNDVINKFMNTRKQKSYMVDDIFNDIMSTKNGISNKNNYQNNIHYDKVDNIITNIMRNNKQNYTSFNATNKTETIDDVYTNILNGGSTYIKNINKIETIDNVYTNILNGGSTYIENINKIETDKLYKDILFPNRGDLRNNEITDENDESYDCD